MFAKRWPHLWVLVAVAACRSPSPPAGRTPEPLPPRTGAQTSPQTPSSAVPVVEGESPEAAVLVPMDNEEDGIAYENEWIYRHYGRFRRRSGGVASLAGRRYDVITVELSDHTQRTLYFDITDFFGRENPKPQ